VRIRGDGSIEGRTRCVEIEYPLDLELVPVNPGAFVTFGAWHARPPPQSSLDFFCDPGVGW